MISGTVFNIQKYSLHDGPGIRTTVFLKGCPLRCAWCHNPEGILPRAEIVVVEGRCLACGECRTACPFEAATAVVNSPVQAVGGNQPLDSALPPPASPQPAPGVLPPRRESCTRCGACVEACPTGARQMIGRAMTVVEVMKEILQDRVFYEDSGGGVTFSGGEPLLQPDFLLALLAACRTQGLHAVLDTTGFGGREHLLAAAALSHLVLYDLKFFDDARHRQFTGVSNRGILANLTALDRAHPNLWIRLPVVPGFNDDWEDLRQLAEFVAGLRSVTLVNLLPFHRNALHKFERLGLTHELDGVNAPSAETMARAAQLFSERGLTVKVGG